MILPDGVLILYALYIPSFIGLYIIEIISILRNWKDCFKSSFFKIYTVLAVVNISACLLGSFVFRLNLYPIFLPLYEKMTNNSGWLTASYSFSLFLFIRVQMGAYYLNCLSQFLGVLLAFNRFTSLYFTLFHDKVRIVFWRLATALGIIACFIIAISPIWFLFDDPARFKPSDDLNALFHYYFIHADANFCEDSIWFNMVVVTFCCNGLSSMFYFACLLRLCLFSSSRFPTAERNLFIVGFCSMICSLPYMAGMVR
ncbi:hypothetical protein PENTCL1PPCAC_3706, partial [Pristionchus entomophagus]